MNLNIRNCAWCGRSTSASNFCSQECEQKQTELLSRPKGVFRTYSEAGRFYGKDPRTIRKYENVLFEINRKLPPPNAKPQTCKVCSATFLTHENRNGYCPSCSASGEGRRAQGRIISEKYKGKGNPNYVDGGANDFERGQRTYRHWAKAVLARDNRCRCCGREDNLDAHHILPFSLVPDAKYDVDNGITLCRFHHIELHRSRLDIRLLPTLVALRLGALPLHEALSNLPEFQALLELPWTQLDEHELIRVVRSTSL